MMKVEAFSKIAVLLSFCFFSSACLSFEGLGFSIEIPSSWEKVYEKDDPSSKMRSYGFQGKYGEEFMIAVSLSALTEHKKRIYKASLRQDDSDLRKNQGLTIISKETALTFPNGERDSILSFQTNKKYTSCEYSVYGPDQLALVTIILQEKPEIADLICLDIVDSIEWNPLP